MWKKFYPFHQKFSQQKKKAINKDDKLTKMPCIVISEICSFLNVNDISKLSRVNKTMNEKANINYIWEKIFYNKYDKLLKETLEEDEYKKFSHTNFESYREL